jgi:hypothetical protein
LFNSLDGVHLFHKLKLRRAVWLVEFVDGVLNAVGLDDEEVRGIAAANLDQPRLAESVATTCHGSAVLFLTVEADVRSDCAHVSFPLQKLEWSCRPDPWCPIKFAK